MSELSQANEDIAVIMSSSFCMDLVTYANLLIWKFLPWLSQWTRGIIRIRDFAFNPSRSNSLYLYYTEKESESLNSMD